MKVSPANNVTPGYAEKALKRLTGTTENDYKTLWKKFEEDESYTHTLNDVWSPQGPVDLYINKLPNKKSWALTTSNPDNPYAAIQIDFDANTRKPVHIISQSDPENYVGRIVDAKILENTKVHKGARKEKNKKGSARGSIKRLSKAFSEDSLSGIPKRLINRIRTLMVDYKYGKDMPWMIKNTELIPVSTDSKEYLVKRKWDKSSSSISQNPIGVCQELAHTLFKKIQGMIPENKKQKYKFNIVAGNSPEYFNQSETTHLFITGKNDKLNNKYGTAIIDPSFKILENTSSFIGKKYKVNNEVQKSSETYTVPIQEAGSGGKSSLVPLGFVGALHPAASDDLKNRILEIGVEKLSGLQNVARIELRKPDGSYEDDSVRKEFMKSLQLQTPELAKMEKIYQNVSGTSGFSGEDIKKITSQIKETLSLSDDTTKTKSKSSHLVEFLNKFNKAINEKSDISNLTQEEQRMILNN